FKDKVVFITGANSGIGYAQAEAFLNQGANVFALDIQENNLIQLKTNYPKQFNYQLGNVANKKDIASAVELTLKQNQSIDILLNTAGILDAYTPTLKTDEALWDRVIDTNLKGTYLVTNSVLPHMLKQKEGSVINMTSIAGLVAGGGGAAYTAPKHAIIG